MGCPSWKNMCERKIHTASTNPALTIDSIEITWVLFDHPRETTHMSRNYLRKRKRTKKPANIKLTLAAATSVEEKAMREDTCRLTTVEKPTKAKSLRHMTLFPKCIILNYPRATSSIIMTEKPTIVANVTKSICL